MASRKRSRGTAKLALVRGGRRTGGAPLEDLFGQIFDPVQQIGARLVVGKQVDDVVTEAVKEAYAAGVAAALEGVRAFAERRAEVDSETGGRVVDVPALDAEITALSSRLAEWKAPRA